MNRNTLDAVLLKMDSILLTLILRKITREILPNSPEVVIKQNYQDHKLELVKRTNLVFPTINDVSASIFEENGGPIQIARTVTRKIDNQEITDIEFKKIMVNGSLEHINNTTVRNTGAPQILSEAKIGGCQMTSSGKQKFEED